MPNIKTNKSELLQIPSQALENPAVAHNKINSILKSMKNSVVALKGLTRSYGFGLLSSAQSVILGVGAAFSTAKALRNFAKVAFYDTTRIAANTWYYQDKKASESAKKEGAESLEHCCKDMEVACRRTKKMLVAGYDATLNTIEGLNHSKDALYYAGDATAKTIQLALEGGAIAYQGAKNVYNMLPAYSAKLHLNVSASIQMEEIPELDLQSLFSASATAC